MSAAAPVSPAAAAAAAVLAAARQYHALQRDSPDGGPSLSQLLLAAANHVRGVPEAGAPADYVAALPPLSLRAAAAAAAVACGGPGAGDNVISLLDSDDSDVEDEEMLEAAEEAMRREEESEAQERLSAAAGASAAAAAAAAAAPLPPLHEERVAADGPDPFAGTAGAAGAEPAWHVAALQAARQCFGVEGLRAPQAVALERLLCPPTPAGGDVLLVAPTGAGKSLVFQLYALLKGGLTVVVSPLVSLVADQVEAAQRAGIDAAAFHGTTPGGRAALVRRLKDMAENTPEEAEAAKGWLARAGAGAGTDTGAGGARPLRLLYVTPEMAVKSKQLKAVLEGLHQRGRVSLLAVDECHCCSQWGYDFRPAYSEVKQLRASLPGVPVLALTATASMPVVRDVCRLLNLRRGTTVFRAPTHRPNLSYAVLRRNGPSGGRGIGVEAAEPAAKQIKKWVTDHCGTLPDGRPPAGIIYVLSRRETEELAIALTSLGWRALPYHGDMEARNRAETQERWAGGAFQVVVATVAFGLGIDRPDVRFVIHQTLPKGLDSLYQESGRAGRDGQPARCLLLWQPTDVMRTSTMVYYQSSELQSLYSVARYAMNRSMCRRQLLAAHFGEELPAGACASDAAACDVCLRQRQPPASQGPPPVNLRQDAKALAALVQQLDTTEEWATVRGTAQLWQGKKRSPELAGIGKASAGVPLETLEEVIVRLVVAGGLREKFRHTPFRVYTYVAPGRRFGALLRGEMDVLVDEWRPAGKRPAWGQAAEAGAPAEAGGAGSGGATSAKRRKQK